MVCHFADTYKPLLFISSQQQQQQCLISLFCSYSCCCNNPFIADVNSIEISWGEGEGLHSGND